MTPRQAFEPCEKLSFAIPMLEMRQECILYRKPNECQYRSEMAPTFSNFSYHVGTKTSSTAIEPTVINLSTYRRLLFIKTHHILFLANQDNVHSPKSLLSLHLEHNDREKACEELTRPSNCLFIYFLRSIQCGGRGMLGQVGMLM